MSTPPVPVAMERGHTALYCEGMTRMRARLALIAGLATLAACARRTAAVPAATPIRPVTVARDVAYAHPPDVVRSAYARALDERGLRVDSATAGELRATVDPSDSVSLVRVVIGRGA